jgi:hypothetical protein
MRGIVAWLSNHEEREGGTFGRQEHEEEFFFKRIFASLPLTGSISSRSSRF